MSFFIGLDLGQLNDYTALAIAERIEPPVASLSAYPWQPGHPLYEKGKHLVSTPQPPLLKVQAYYHLRHLQRFPLRTSYPSIVAEVKALVSLPELDDDVTLVVDHTGVGVAVFDMLEDADLPCPLYGVTIHGGNTVTYERGRYAVPKRDLITFMQVLLQHTRLRIAKDLPDAGTLTKELLEYRLKIDPTTAHDSYNAREGKHDDVILAAALACWLGEKIGVGLRVHRFEFPIRPLS